MDGGAFRLNFWIHGLSVFKARHGLTQPALLHCIDATGTPLYPYNINRAYFGDTVGGAANGVPDSDEAGATATMSQGEATPASEAPVDET